MIKRLKQFFKDCNTSDLLLPGLLALIAGIIFYKNYFTVLDKVQDGIAAIATYEGVDIAARIRKFYFSGIVVVASFVALTVGMQAIIDKHWLPYRERTFINTLALLSIILTLVGAFIYPQWHNTSKIFCGFTFITTLYCFLFSSIKKQTKLHWDKICFTIALSFIIYVLIKDVAALYHHPLSEDAIIFISLLSYSLIIVLPVNFERMFFAGIPLALAPCLYMLSTEFFLVVNNKSQSSFSIAACYFLLLACIILFSVLIFIFCKKQVFNTRRAIKFFGLLFTISIACCALYAASITNWTEDFELANNANAPMNIFKFGQIPFVDFYTSHLLADQLPGIIYAWIHGYNANLDFVSYLFIVNLIGYIILYFFLHIIFRQRWFPIFFLALMPYVTVQFPLWFSFVLLCYILLHRFFEEDSQKNFLLLTLGVALTTLWKIDVAIATIPALFGALIFWAIAQQKGKFILQTIMKAALLWAAILLIVAIVLYASDHPFSDHFKDALSYIGAAQAHGVTEIFNNEVYKINTVYFLFPVAVIFICLFAVIKYFKQQIKLHDVLLIIFFTVVYCFNFQRGLVRHVLIYEGEKLISSFAYFLIPISLIILLNIRKYKMWSYAALSLMMIFSFRNPHPPEGNMLLTDAINEIEKRSFIGREDIGKMRVPAYEAYLEKYEPLNQIMRNNFKPTASFIDMSNTPLLYYALQRPVPGYFCQYMQNMVTASIQERNINELRKKDVPIAIFSSYPKHEFFDKTDGVENTIRYHKISNYIFNNYNPFGIVSNKYLWLKNNVVLQYNNAQPLPDSVIYQPEHYNINKLAWLWARGKNESQKGIILQKESDNTWLLPLTINKKKGNYFLIEVDNKTGSDQTLQVAYGSNNMERGFFEFWVSGKNDFRYYLVPVSTQYNWHVFNSRQLNISNLKDNMTVRSVSLFNDL